MSIWTEIKHALNGTLGTDKFKPLDVILHDEIKSHKGLVASDNLYKVILDLGSSRIELYNKPELFRVNWDGSFKLSFNVFLQGGGTGYRTFGYRVYKNGEIYRDISTGSNDVVPTVDVLVDAKVGDVIGLKLLYGRGGTSVTPYLGQGVYVYANEVDLTAIDVLEV